MDMIEITLRGPAVRREQTVRSVDSNKQHTEAVTQQATYEIRRQYTEPHPNLVHYAKVSPIASAEQLQRADPVGGRWEPVEPRDWSVTIEGRPELLVRSARQSAREDNEGVTTLDKLNEWQDYDAMPKASLNAAIRRVMDDENEVEA